MTSPNPGRHIPFTAFAKDFSRAVREGGVYKIEEITPLIGVEKPSIFDADLMEKAIAFNNVFHDFRRALIDTIPDNAPYRGCVVVVGDPASLSRKEGDFGLTSCANGYFVDRANLVSVLNYYQSRIRAARVSETEQYSMAMQRALINAAVGGRHPVIVGPHANDDVVLRLQAHGYDVMHKERLESPVAVAG